MKGKPSKPATSTRTGILFVCMGNICRSPLAEGLFVKKATDRGVIARFRVDSAGTGGWHAGEAPDPRIQQLAKKNNIKLTGRARRIEPEDFERFDMLMCMDEENLASLARMGAPREKLHLLLDFDHQNPEREVPDPYYGTEDGFDTAYRLLDAACNALLDELLSNIRQPEGT